MDPSLTHNMPEPAEPFATRLLHRVAEAVAATAKGKSHRPGKYQKLVKALGTPVADLHLSARPASTLQMLNIQYVYELVQKSQLDLFRFPNFGREVPPGG